MANNEPQNESFMMKLATFIVDKRNLFFLLVVISVIFTMFSRNWVKVENDMAICARVSICSTSMLVAFAK